MSKAPKVAAPDVIASCFAVNITIRDVDAGLLDRLTTAIAQYFSRTCAEGVIARNESNATILDLACKIRFDKCINKRFMIQAFAPDTFAGPFPRGIPATELCLLTRGRSSYGTTQPLETCVPYGPGSRGG